MRLTAREKSLVIEAIDRRATDLRRKAHLCSGSLYPSIWRKEADELDEAKLKLLGYKRQPQGEPT